ncbi:MAG: tetratricopeptide repeat protein [Bacteroidetes bacterium]|jgi:TolB-like protein/AraC-like DNA-binding protein|nr:tetratricopeptide repeat protein [Bacteroidota bacterium]
MNQKSIAVLPFVNMSSDPENEYFSDGVTEEIINALTTVKELKVTARTSSFAFKNKQVDVRHIGNELGVITVLEGSIRRMNDRVRISAQLIRTDDGFHIWSDKYDRKLTDIFELQDEISLEIAEQIRENFGHFEVQDHLVVKQTHSVEAYDAFLQGRFYELKWNHQATKRAISHYKDSIRLDAENPRPYYNIVQCYITLTFWNAIDKQKGIQHAEFYLSKGAEVDNTLPEYYLACAAQKIMLQWDAEGAYEYFKMVLSQNPNHPEALESLAGLYITVGSFDEALKHIKKALEVNPLSPNHTFLKGNIYYFAGEYEKAIETMNKVLKIDPSWIFAIQVKAACLVLLKKETVLNNFLKTYDDLSFSNYFKNLYSLLHHKKDLHIELAEDIDSEYQPWELYFHTLRGNYNQALFKLKWGLQNQIGQYYCHRFDPLLENLRKQDGYKKLESETRISLPLMSEELQTQSNSTTPISNTDDIEELRNALIQSMEKDQLYLKQDLSLVSLAKHLQTSSNKLSRLINVTMDKNFNEFVNDYRIESFQKKALDSKNQNFTLLGLAFESGFNSKSAFNDYFKKKTGRTPRSWLKAKK